MPAKSRRVVGKETVAYGPDQVTEYRLRYRVVELEDLVPSHDVDLSPNPRFPRELQPRLRSRTASRLQIERIAARLRPEALLVDTQALDRGPIIVGPDLVVESGNGRTIALKLAALQFPDRYLAYKGALLEALAEDPSYGIDPEDVEKMDKPVLVRERLSKVDREHFVREANQAAVLAMSPLEQARQDAERISDAALTSLVVGENQSIDQALRAATNRPFIAAFLEKLPENERAALVDANGALNQLGLQRVKAALFAKVFPGEAGHRLTQSFFESIDPALKNIEAALFDALPLLARAEGLVRTGQRSADLAFGDDIARAVDMLTRLRQQGLPVELFLQQTSFIERDLTPSQEKLLAFLDVNARSRKVVREFLKAYAQAVLDSPHPSQGALLPTAQPTKEEVLDQVIKQSQGKQVSGALFDFIEAKEKLEAFAGASSGARGPRLEGPPGREEAQGPPAKVAQAKAQKTPAEGPRKEVARPSKPPSGTGKKTAARAQAKARGPSSKKAAPKKVKPAAKTSGPGRAGDGAGKGVTAAQARKRLADVTTGTRSGKRRNPQQDIRRRAREVAPTVARTEEERRAQRRWFRFPNEMDFEGVDTPPQEASTESKTPKGGLSRKRASAPGDTKHSKRWFPIEFTFLGR